MPNGVCSNGSYPIIERSDAWYARALELIPATTQTQVMPFEVLHAAWREAEQLFEREHTAPFVWDRPERFRIGNVRREDGRDLSHSHRFTVDYPEDHSFVAAVYDALWTPRRPVFGLDEILDLLEARPDIHALNARHRGVSWQRHHAHELRTLGSGSDSAGAIAEGRG